MDDITGFGLVLLFIALACGVVYLFKFLFADGVMDWDSDVKREVRKQLEQAARDAHKGGRKAGRQ